jgi:8-oxo-dGTP pyrophosphatase MutT (NUDIX family)
MPSIDDVKIRVAAVILYQGERVLLQHRDDLPDIAWPNHWAIFGGRIEDGETPEEGALREIEEELELRLAPPLALVHQGIDGIRERFVYAARLLVPLESLTLLEGQGMALLSHAEMEAYPLAPAHRVILNQFFARPSAELSGDQS